MCPTANNAPDPRFSWVQRAIPALEEGLIHPDSLPGDRAHAAVSLVLRPRQEMEILLIRRAEAEGDPWSGQMALPGGRKDSNDKDLLHTAIRETLEETGVDLHTASTLLGALVAVAPATHRLPPIDIYPFVFGVPEETQATSTSREVDEVIWTPLQRLKSPEAEGTVTIHYGDGGSRDFPCIRVGERVIWGLTYRILTGFLSRVEEHAPLLLGD